MKLSIRFTGRTNFIVFNDVVHFSKIAYSTYHVVLKHSAHNNQIQHIPSNCILVESLDGDEHAASAVITSVEEFNIKGE